MFETQKFGNKTSSGEIGFTIRTLASPKVGQGQVSGGVSVLYKHAASVENVLWKPLGIRSKVKFGIRSRSVIGSKIGGITDQWRMSMYMVIIQNVV